MTRIKLPYVVRDTDRHGNVRFYFRKRGEVKLRLPGELGSTEFMAAYDACLKGKPIPRTETGPQPPARPTSGTLDWLCNAYYQAPEYTGSALGTQQSKRYILKAICNEPLAPGAKARVGDLPFAQMTSKAVRMLRDREAARPTTANNRLSVLKTLFKWAIEAEHFEGVNPVLAVPKIQHRSDGHHTWTIDELRQYEARHEIGTQARLALALLAYTGQRRSDVVVLGRQHITKEGRLRFVQRKNREKNPVTIEIPMLPELISIIDASPTGDLTFLVNQWGKPWSERSFSGKFRVWCDEAQLPHCTAHGVRKAAACAAAEGGATEMEMMAIFGWRKADMARLYTQKARRAEMAARSMHLLGDRQNTDGTNVSHFSAAKIKSGTKGQK